MFDASQPTMKTYKIINALCNLITIYSVKALVTGNIKIVGQTGGVAQYLPGSYVNTIPRWVVETSTENNNDDEQSLISLTKLIGSGIASQQEEGEVAQVINQFVNPISNEELWWPADLETIQIRPTLDVFMSSATPSYLLAGLEVRVPPSSSKDGKEWKNFGMNSQPMASQWTSFGIAVENGFRVETFIGHVQDNKKNIDQEDNEEIEVNWEPLYSIDNDEKSCYSQKNDATQGTLDAIQTLGTLLAMTDDNSPLAKGMHIVSIPIDSDWRDLPSPNLEKNQTIRLACVGTVEPDAMELLDMDSDLVAMSATSILNVNVERIAPGCKSEYIPVRMFILKYRFINKTVFNVSRIS